MFDEVDAGTAVFKVSRSPPSQGSFATYEGMPADWYLCLTAEGAKEIRGGTAKSAGNADHPVKSH
jgi:hypothetical protein